MEPLSEPHTDFVTTADEAIAFVDDVAYPNVGVALDGYHLASEAGAPDAAIRRTGDRLAHFHADNTDGRGPGRGTVEYEPIAETLDAIGYDGFISLEVHADIFRTADDPRELDPDDIAREAIEFLEAVFEA